MIFARCLCGFMPNLHKKLNLTDVCCRESSKNERLMTTKAVTKYEGPKKFLAAPKMVSFLRLPAEKKTRRNVKILLEKEL